MGGTARQDYFTHFEPSQSLDVAKTGDPQNKPPGHLQAELGLSHVTRARLEPTSVRCRTQGGRGAEICFTYIVTCAGRLSFI